MSTRMDDCAATVFQLTDDAQTREVFPYEFELRLQVALAGSKLTLAAVHRNTGARTLPLHFGYHPYFLLPQAAKGAARIETDATRVFDNRTGRSGTLAGSAPAPNASEGAAPAEPAPELSLDHIDLTGDEVDLHLLDHHLAGTSLSWPQRAGLVRLGWSEQFRHFVVWTLRDRDFVCLEPWTAAADALNTGQNLIAVAPGESVATTFEVEWQAK
jgi:galactose mutarotase-like enzyme